MFDEKHDAKIVAAAELKALVEEDPIDYPGHHNAHRMPITVTLHDRKAEHPGQNQSVRVHAGEPDLPGVIGGPLVTHALQAANLSPTARVRCHRDGRTLEADESLYAHAHDGDHYDVL